MLMLPKLTDLTLPINPDLADPFIALEPILDSEVLSWVETENSETLKQLDTHHAREMQKRLAAVLGDPNKIATVELHGEYVYNFWTDTKNPRGIWRRTTWIKYQSGNPQWQNLLDLDALGAIEKESWVWVSAELNVAGTRALITLSPGGTDSNIVREFDLEKLEFVSEAQGGFNAPLSKGWLIWANDDASAVWVVRENGAESLTASGYPAQVRYWQRGMELAEAKLFYALSDDEILVTMDSSRYRLMRRDLLEIRTNFYEKILWVSPLGGASDFTQFTKVDLPDSAEKTIRGDLLVATLREEWQLPECSYPAGAVLAISWDAFCLGSRDFQVLFSPSENTAYLDLAWTSNHLVITYLEDVKARVVVHAPQRDNAGKLTGEWLVQNLDITALGAANPGINQSELPYLQVVFSSCEMQGEKPEFCNSLWFILSGYLTPDSYGKLDLHQNGELAEVQMLGLWPTHFDATDMVVRQYFSTSLDGTKIPYFVIGKESLMAKPNPTILYGYGGFEVPILPEYLGPIGASWLAEDGIWVMANIRGGGEYGPRWHQAGLKEHRHRVYEDMACVAQDLCARGITTPALLGVSGGSNGGLLVGNMLMQYPELFGAVVCQVPLLDMKRYSQLLAGASWMAEYGDPNTKDWEFIKSFSPYHLYDNAQDLPPTFFLTSTRDDRVHPSHARKMMALLKTCGQQVYYYENIEGGHAGAADFNQRAWVLALVHEFCYQKLGLGQSQIN